MKNKLWKKHETYTKLESTIQMKTTNKQTNKQNLITRKTNK